MKCPTCEREMEKCIIVLAPAYVKSTLEGLPKTFSPKKEFVYYKCHHCKYRKRKIEHDYTGGWQFTKVGGKWYYFSRFWKPLSRKVKVIFT